MSKESLGPLWEGDTKSTGVRLAIPNPHGLYTEILDDLANKPQLPVPPDELKRVFVSVDDAVFSKVGITLATRGGKINDPWIDLTADSFTTSFVTQREIQAY